MSGERDGGVTFFAIAGFAPEGHYCIAPRFERIQPMRTKDGSANPAMLGRLNAQVWHFGFHVGLHDRRFGGIGVSAEGLPKGAEEVFS